MTINFPHVDDMRARAAAVDETAKQLAKLLNNGQPFTLTSHQVTGVPPVKLTPPEPEPEPEHGTIPDGWARVTEGGVLLGDKSWSPLAQNWVPCGLTIGFSLAEHPRWIIIRKTKRDTYPIPFGWTMVLSGVSKQGDKYWSNGLWLIVDITAGDPWYSYNGPLIRNTLAEYQSLRDNYFPRSPRAG